MSSFARFLSDRWGDSIYKLNPYEQNIVDRCKPYMNEEDVFVVQNMQSGDYGVCFELEYEWQRGDDDPLRDCLMTNEEAIANAGKMALKLCDIAESENIVHACCLALDADFIFNRRLGLHFFITLDHLDKIELFREAIAPESQKKIYNVHVSRKMSYRVKARSHIEATQIIVDEWADTDAGGSVHDLIDDEVEQVYAEEARVQ
jgi:hypothetical protein